jgi:hypothetical protein
MGDRPTAAELVVAVRDWITDELRPALEGRLAFHARVAANALGIAARELDAPGADPHVLARARALLGEEVGAEDLDAALAAAIRAGVLAAGDAEVVALVRATVRAKLAIANPGYLDEDTP